MKVTLRQEGEVVCRLEVLETGALVLRVPEGLRLQELELSVRDSRRLAGAIVENSIKGTIGAVKSDIKRQAREQLEQLLGQLEAVLPEDEDGG